MIFETTYKNFPKSKITNLRKERPSEISLGSKVSTLAFPSVHRFHPEIKKELAKQEKKKQHKMHI